MSTAHLTPRRTTRAQYGQLVSSLAAQILRHALEAHRQRDTARTAVFTRALAQDAARREALAARTALRNLRDSLDPADFAHVFRGLRALYRVRLAAQREADAIVAAQSLARVLERERQAIAGFGAIARAA